MTASHPLPFAGAHIEDDVVLHFGDGAAELRATASGSIVAPLSRFRVLRFAGEDAESFLHGQLTCDVKGLRMGRASFGGYCTAQGRLLATFLLWREPDGFGMLIPRDIAAAIRRRLQMYVLRAKVKIADESAQRIAFGLSGLAAGQAAVAADLPSPGGPFDVAAGNGHTVIGLPGGRCIALIAAAASEHVWSALAASLKPAGTPCWEWLDVKNGIPWITAPTQEQFVPQMVNLELIGGVTFQKGCYPGQEVVARTQYRAKTKRRMHLAHVGADAIPGMETYSASLGGQASGMVVNAVPSPEGGRDVLVVLHPEALAAPIQLGAPAGPMLALHALPYDAE